MLLRCRGSRGRDWGVVGSHRHAGKPIPFLPCPLYQSSFANPPNPQSLIPNPPYSGRFPMSPPVAPVPVRKLRVPPVSVPSPPLVPSVTSREPECSVRSCCEPPTIDSVSSSCPPPAVGLNALRSFFAASA